MSAGREVGEDPFPRCSNLIGSLASREGVCTGSLEKPFDDDIRRFQKKEAASTV